MRNFLKIFLGVVVFCGVSLAASDEFDISKLSANKWKCEASQEDKESGISVKSESVDVYDKNNTGHSTGTVKMKFPQMEEEMVLGVFGEFTWEIVKGKYLVSTAISIKAKSISHPELNEVLNLEDMFPENMSASAEIIKLDDKEFITKEESSGVVETCKVVK